MLLLPLTSKTKYANNQLQTFPSNHWVYTIESGCPVQYEISSCCQNSLKHMKLSKILLFHYSFRKETSVTAKSFINFTGGWMPPALWVVFFRKMKYGESTRFPRRALSSRVRSRNDRKSQEMRWHSMKLHFTLLATGKHLSPYYTGKN